MRRYDMDEAAVQNMLYGLETARYQQELRDSKPTDVEDDIVEFCNAIAGLAEG